MRPFRVGVACAIAMVSISCGGGGGGSGTKTVTIETTPALTGTVVSDGRTSIANSGPISIGDVVDTLAMPPTELAIRAFVSFDLSGIPAGATVVSATLHSLQVFQDGTPYGTLGDLVVDQLVYSPALDAGAYSRSYPVNQGIVFSTDPNFEVKTASVTSAVQDAVDAAVGEVEFRLRFELELDGDVDPDYTQFNTNPPEGEVPKLVVTYRP